MTKAEQNKAIAKILGFKVFDPGKKSGSPVQWIYPYKYADLRYSVPTTTVPDFIHLIDLMIKIIQENTLVHKDLDTELEHGEN
jgi:hypothetical protein